MAQSAVASAFRYGFPSCGGTPRYTVSGGRLQCVSCVGIIRPDFGRPGAFSGPAQVHIRPALPVLRMTADRIKEIGPHKNPFGRPAAATGFVPAEKTDRAFRSLPVLHRQDRISILSVQTRNDPLAAAFSPDRIDLLPRSRYSKYISTAVLRHRKRSHTPAQQNI